MLIGWKRFLAEFQKCTDRMSRIPCFARNDNSDLKWGLSVIPNTVRNLFKPHEKIMLLTPTKFNLKLPLLLLLGCNLQSVITSGAASRLQFNLPPNSHKSFFLQLTVRLRTRTTTQFFASSIQFF
jgi:hypothetical protein